MNLNSFWYGIVAGLIIGFFVAINLVGLNMIISRQRFLNQLNNLRSIVKGERRELKATGQIASATRYPIREVT